MELLNATPLVIGYTLGLDVDGTERLVVVAKGTYRIPRAGGVAPQADEQAPLVYADTFTGEPGHSAVHYESDFAPHKPHCDVLLVGTAYAPEGRPVKSLPVGLRVGALTKGFEVLGRRHWVASLSGGVTPSAPEPFVCAPISYDVAYGGGLPSPDNPALIDAYAANPVGAGYAPRASDHDLFAKPLPRTQRTGEPVSSPRGRYAPMAFGPLGRNFAERIAHAGTYDARWLEENYPFLPPDFDTRYFQAAPADQRLPRAVGGEPVQLLHLTPEPVPPFYLPTVEVPVEFTDADIQREETLAVLDTIVLEPDLGRLQLVWRASKPLKRNIKEVRQVVVGRMPRGWYRARELGKTYYPSLRHLVEAKRGA